MNHYDAIQQFIRDLATTDVNEYSLQRSHLYPFPLHAETQLLAALAELGTPDWVEMAALRRSIKLQEAGRLLTLAFRLATLAIRERRAELLSLALWLLTLDDDHLDSRDVVIVALTIIHAQKQFQGTDLLNLSAVLSDCTFLRKLPLERMIQGHLKQQPDLWPVRVRFVDSGANSYYSFGDGPR